MVAYDLSEKKEFTCFWQICPLCHTSEVSLLPPFPPLSCAGANVCLYLCVCVYEKEAALAKWNG